jgi:hypothetical protein
MSHTPGPWVFGVNGNERQPSYRGPGFYDNPEVFSGNVQIVGCDEYNVFGPYENASEREANIRLICAAPDLLAALKQIAAIEDKMNGGDWDEIEDARQIAQAAIAKAEGK